MLICARCRQSIPAGTSACPCCRTPTVLEPQGVSRVGEQTLEGVLFGCLVPIFLWLGSAVAILGGCYSFMDTITPELEKTILTYTFLPVLLLTCLLYLQRYRSQPFFARGVGYSVFVQVALFLLINQVITQYGDAVY